MVWAKIFTWMRCSVTIFCISGENQPHHSGWNYIRSHGEKNAMEYDILVLVAIYDLSECETFRRVNH